MAKIYQGESLNMVFRCKSKCYKPVDLSGVVVSVLLRDSSGDVAYRFSNNIGEEDEGIKELLVRENYVICSLTNEDTAKLSGSYVIEVKVKVEEVVMIAVSKKIKVYPSIIGEEVNL
ncbi:MAG: hypothetical protein NC410_08960 [Oscillibacter sp.]|nr:hypothetical protein [Oscillibacter sp.]